MSPPAGGLPAGSGAGKHLPLPFSKEMPASTALADAISFRGSKFIYLLNYCCLKITASSPRRNKLPGWPPLGIFPLTRAPTPKFITSRMLARERSVTLLMPRSVRSAARDVRGFGRRSVTGSGVTGSGQLLPQSSQLPQPRAGSPRCRQRIPGMTWERADNRPAAKPARPSGKKCYWPSVRTRSAHVAGRDRSPMLSCESSAVSEWEKCLRMGREASGSDQTHPSGLATSNTGLQQVLQRAHCSLRSISNNLPTGILSSKLPSVGVLIKYMHHWCTLLLSGLGQRTSLTPLHDASKLPQRYLWLRQSKGAASSHHRSAAEAADVSGPRDNTLAAAQCCPPHHQGTRSPANLPAAA